VPLNSELHGLYNKQYIKVDLCTFPLQLQVWIFLHNRYAGATNVFAMADEKVLD
jgi:hypothetical protein